MSQSVAHRSGWSVCGSVVTESNLWPAETWSCHPAPAQRSLPGRPPPSPATPATLSPSSPPIRAHPPSTDRLLHHQHPEEEVHLGREGDLPDGQRQAQLLSSPRPPPDSEIKRMIIKIEEGRARKEERKLELGKFKPTKKEGNVEIETLEATARYKLKSIDRKKEKEEEEDREEDEEEDPGRKQLQHHHRVTRCTNLHVPGPEAGPAPGSGTLGGSSGFSTARGSTSSSSCSSSGPAGVSLITVGKKQGERGFQGLPGGEIFNIASLYGEEPCQTTCRNTNRPDCTATGYNWEKEDDRSSGDARTTEGQMEGLHG